MKKAETAENTGTDTNNNTEEVTGICRVRKFLDSALAAGWHIYEYDPYESWFCGQFQEFEYVFIIWQISPNWDFFRAKCIAVGNPEEESRIQDVQRFCDEWNASHPFPHAYIDKVSKELVTETVMQAGEDVSEEFIRDTLLPDLFNSNIAFFEEALERDLISKNLWVTDLQEE